MKFNRPSHPVRLAAAAAAIMTLVVALAVGTAGAWSGDTTAAAGHASCNTANGVQSGSFTVTNVGAVAAKVNHSSGPVFLVNDTIPAHGHKTEGFTEAGSFHGQVTLTIQVTYPGPGGDSSTFPVGPVTVSFPGGCHPPTTTTTRPPTTTTTAPATTTTLGHVECLPEHPAPCDTTTTAPAVTTPTCIVAANNSECAPIPVQTEIGTAVAVEATPAFTG